MAHDMRHCSVAMYNAGNTWVLCHSGRRFHLRALQVVSHTGRRKKLSSLSASFLVPKDVMFLQMLDPVLALLQCGKAGDDLIIRRKKLNFVTRNGGPLGETKSSPSMLMQPARNGCMDYAIRGAKPEWEGLCAMR
jgi:hypothetical protein